MYGLTECKRVSYLPPECIDTKPGSVGIPMPGCEVRIVDEMGRPVKDGQTGELIIRGDNVMQGYWNDPVLTDKTFLKEMSTGEIWLWSGDLFRKDEEDFLYYVGRKDDLIKTKEERVSPKEIENIIAQNPDVEEVAVIGVPDELLGKAIKAFVVLKDSTFSTSNDIQKYCAEHLEVNIVPRFIEFIKELPRTANGKIDKASLV
jgi:acyl-CoA synthetase (AMP-forming)/AMP-acid ligase II